MVNWDTSEAPLCQPRYERPQLLSASVVSLLALSA